MTTETTTTFTDFPEVLKVIGERKRKRSENAKRTTAKRADMRERESERERARMAANSNEKQTTVEMEKNNKMAENNKMEKNKPPLLNFKNKSKIFSSIRLIDRISNDLY